MSVPMALSDLKGRDVKGQILILIHVESLLEKASNISNYSSR